MLIDNSAVGEVVTIHEQKTMKKPDINTSTLKGVEAYNKLHIVAPELAEALFRIYQNFPQRILNDQMGEDSFNS